MLFTTPSQWAALALVLVAGWFFGLASHSGGKKWKARYATERDTHAAARKDADTRVNDANRRVAELEQENARLARAAPVTAATVRPAAAARPAFPTGERRGWFDWGQRA